MTNDEIERKSRDDNEMFNRMEAIGIFEVPEMRRYTQAFIILKLSARLYSDASNEEDFVRMARKAWGER